MDYAGYVLTGYGVVFGAVGGYALWLVVHRFRLAWLEDQLEATSLDVAIAERRAEALV